MKEEELVGEKAPEFRADNVTIDTKEIEEINGENKVEEIKFKDGSSLKTDGVFVAQGVAGSSEFAKKLGIITNKDKIVVNENMETNIKGIYACGDWEYTHVETVQEDYYKYQKQYMKEQKQDYK